jgi:hypothetical protein
VSDIDIAVVDSLKALDPKRPIREADLRGYGSNVRVGARQRFSVFIQFGLFDQSFDDDLVANGVNDRNKVRGVIVPQLGRFDRHSYLDVLNAACTQQHRSHACQQSRFRRPRDRL